LSRLGLTRLPILRPLAEARFPILRPLAAARFPALPALCPALRAVLPSLFVLRPTILGMAVKILVAIKKLYFFLFFSKEHTDVRKKKSYSFFKKVGKKQKKNAKVDLVGRSQTL